MKAQFSIASALPQDYTLKQQLDWHMEPDVPITIRRPHFAVRSFASLATLSRASAWVGLMVLALGFVPSARAALQFDVFLGYGGQPSGTDGVVREAGWFPVACEVFNDGPSFNAVFELSSSQMGGGQTRRMVVELPTNTRKRFVLPAFTGTGGYSTWDARLIDERRKVRAEKTGLRPRNLASDSILLGAVPRTFGGLPKFPELKNNNNRSAMQPVVARMPVEQFPDDPTALESLDALYLNTEKALEMKVSQAAALLGWMHQGGHLILGVEQPSDVNANPWLRPLLPCDLNNVSTLKTSREMIQWLNAGDTQEFEMSRQRGNQAPRVARADRGKPITGIGYPADWLALDPEFEQVEFAVTTGQVRDGQVLLAQQGTPLIVSAKRGRGQLTVLLFSPEREPFRSWKNRDWFWAKLSRVPAGWFGPGQLIAYGGQSVDGVFGAMIDSRQVRKLPVQWLLLLLVVYLLVIGPLDQYWLKRINKQMLTWITFPAYVALFSLLIYYIGYKLRAGETEWNELHLVDILPRGEQAEWRGRTYASVYSPVNARYKVAGEQRQATLRGEFMSSWSGSQEGSRADVLQRTKGFDADIFVPVWTSQLFASDWWHSGEYPFNATVAAQGRNWKITVENHLSRPLKDLRLVVQNRIYSLGDLPPNKVSTFSVEQNGPLLRDFVVQNASQFQAAAQSRQRAFGDNTSRWLELNSANLTAVSFVSQWANPDLNQRGFVYPSGLELSPLIERGDAVLLAWDPDHAPFGGSLNQFKTARSHRNMMLRLAVPLGEPARL
jgi:hypothetical protein